MAGNPDRLDLFLAHRGALLNYASRIVGDRAHAEDVVQEAFLRFDAAVVEQGPGGQGLSEPLAYLYRIVRNLSLDLRRKLGRERNRQVADSEESLAQIGEDRPSPEAAVGARHELALVVAAMAELPERTRVALEMHRFGGCSLREISAHLGISVGLAHSLVTDGLEHCRQRLYRR
ncbi:sigma-70 family RNA polymerase sigma factor [Oceanibaculum nanhaiense]|uniref:sigma-70 family RNA polymerase sigma factor n=1 Tax=Oceanibaculum nanhaiense TaxID=1909734 RepID=UPI000A368820|nr:sigma-70 family RNA polymerase sigma factor [Oceanibaculum nanhaiense]MBC7136125.1 sigma-70 family RNA polymerase sigma factor [Oceanibaculum nanhaiense]